ncbi:MAG TPA: aspartate aminotransferase family protein, partial [Anaerolineae bacterium]|nr:aspartate aminotransferase family protein [Anaerolineae bacterium]
QTYKRPPFVIERGEGVYLYDTEGRRYLDFVGGIAVNALGYGPPEVLAAIRDQAAKLIHVSNLYHTIPHAELAKLLVENSFADRVFFCNSGTEAIEGALKFARKWAKTNFGEDKIGIVAFSGSFHGRTFGALATTSREKYRKPFEPLLPGVTFARFNDVDSARAVVNEKTCAVIVEPLQGEGGVHPAREDFLVALRELCDAHNALLIFDEVQCGLGRTGTLWAHQPYGVQPDLMALAKPLGGGLPIGATLLTQRVADVITVGDHGSTFAANALICAVAQAVFRRLSDEDFLAGVREKGEYLAAKLEALKEKHPCLVEVRGRGLIWGLELTVKAEGLIARGYEEGLIVCSAGEKVSRLLPPLVVEKEHLDLAVEKLDGLLAQVQE